jgi:hypothetical protein
VDDENHCGFTDNSLASHLDSRRRQNHDRGCGINAQFLPLGFAEKRGFVKDDGG